MPSQTQTGRATKGSVQILVSNDRLQLRFRHAGKRYYLSLGLPDTRTNRKAADLKARQIELDIISGNFDSSLAKYKPVPVPTKITPSQTPTTPEISLTELWSQYCEIRQPKVAPGTWCNGYMVNTSHLKNCPYKSLAETQRIFDWATANLKPDPAKRFIQALGACCKWAMKVKLIDHNPFSGMSSEIRVKKTSTEDNDIDPFTKTEREAIVQAFARDRYYAHYTNFVRFLFYTGCRPSEAIALQWKHISSRDIVFEQAVVKSSRGLVLKKGLKTQANRKFPINAQLKDLLDTLKPEDASPDTFIFPGPRRRFIDIHNFRNRAWARVLSELDFRYRKPYQSRHTFITLCLEAGISAQQVAKWVGNTPEVIMKHYAGTIAQVQVPEV